jgi:glycine/D-amino acid oxidase-like deaminating enzyme
MTQQKRNLDANSVFSKKILRKFALKPNPPWVSEYYVNNAWFETAQLDQTKPNAPLLDKKTKADIAIIGGGFTGLSSAYHLARKFPFKRIILLEAARCGYGASGRNGGHAIVFPATQILEVYKKLGRESASEFVSVAKQGMDTIKALIGKHGLRCDLEESGSIVLIEKERHIEGLKNEWKKLESLGIESEFFDRQAICDKFKTTHFWGGIKSISEGGLDPCKLALEMKSLVETMPVELFEQTRVTSVTPGKTVVIKTEFGEVLADAVVVGTNGYSPALGLFKKYIIPFNDYVIATESLNSEQLASIGWEDREALSDSRYLFNYFRLSADNRIVFGGEIVKYYYGSRPSSGNNKYVLSLLEKRLLEIWPQLKGVKIGHRWGGTDGLTRDMLPMMGVIGDYKNIYYSVGYSGEGVCWANLAGKIISQLYAKEDTDLTRFFFLNRKPPYIPPEPFRKIGFDMHVKLFELKDRLF